MLNSWRKQCISELWHTGYAFASFFEWAVFGENVNLVSWQRLTNTAIHFFIQFKRENPAILKIFFFLSSFSEILAQSHEIHLWMPFIHKSPNNCLCKSGPVLVLIFNNTSWFLYIYVLYKLKGIYVKIRGCT